MIDTPTYAAGDRVTVQRSASHPHLIGRVGSVVDVRPGEAYVSFRKTKLRFAENVWVRCEDLHQ